LVDGAVQGAEQEARGGLRLGGELVERRRRDRLALGIEGARNVLDGAREGGGVVAEGRLAKLGERAAVAASEDGLVTPYREHVVGAATFLFVGGGERVARFVGAVDELVEERLLVGAGQLGE